MDFLLYLALVPALGVTAQWLAWRTGAPSILVLLLFGILLGWFVQPDAFLADLTDGNQAAGPNLLFPLVALSVGVVMFEGGLTLKLGELGESGSSSLRLVTIGALLSFIGNSVAAHLLLDWGWQLSALLGAILVVTGPTVIGPLLRQVRPSRRVASTLKWEGIVIDPIGAVLAVLVYEEVLLQHSSPEWTSVIRSLTWTLSVGLILGCVGGAVLTQALRRFWVPDHLQGVAALTLALLLFAISNELAHESGLITVTVLGIWLTNQKHFDIEHIVELKENLRTLLIGCLFIVLGSRVNLADIGAVGLPGLALLAALVLIVRPVSVYLSLLGSPLNYRERTFIAGLAPRGIVAAAVSSVFALGMESHSDLDIPGSDQLATVTFLVIIGTVSIYGIAAGPLARFLKLAEEVSSGILIVGADPWVREFAEELSQAKVPLLLVDTNYNKVTQARMAGIRAECANILNEHVRDDLDLTGISRFMAVTPNDEVNSLALRECRTRFDSSQQYQLTYKSKTMPGRRELTKSLLGRELFGEGVTYSRLRDMHDAGAMMKSTKLSAEFTYEDFTAKYGEQAIVMCSIDHEGVLKINTIDDPLVPVPGQTIVAFVTVTPVPTQHAARDNGNSERSVPESDASHTGDKSHHV
ncbi:cation:proton antiporter [Allorhodopirellula solitaria]|uniref:K(+)/H(+) antiporter NhaP2 n=1 Tax=Allorhodopirellula solitaria TaxID=2527987 RepID=A0A5C5YDX1_9BACT|nr:sodium:proton antiporter [Allorhodopirellula solitaria]TWT73947.1 K(+)/H(+) antiporter NhaP2 [Allorhodopirellula solitaria]